MDRQQENNGFGPLSKPRGKASLLAALFVVSFCVAVHLTGPEQSMKIDYRKINRSIDDNQLIIVDWHRLA